MARRTGSAARALAAAAALAVAGCGRGAPERLVLVDLRQPATSLTFVAESAGCFRQEGLEVERRTVDLGRDALTALLGEGRAADVAIAYETPTLRRFQSDGRLRVLTALHTSARNTRIVARRDRGVRELGDLRGKRIGSTPGTNTGFFVATLLTFAGIDPSEVTIVDLEPADAVTALSAGAIDAAALFAPFAERARAAVGDGAVELQIDLYTEFSLVATRDDVIAARRPALLALLRALACAERAARERPEQAFSAVRAAFPDRTEEDVRAALGRVRRGLGLDGVLLTVLRREGQWLWHASLHPGAAPDPSALLEPGLLDEVDPEAVNLPGMR